MTNIDKMEDLVVGHIAMPTFKSGIDQDSAKQKAKDLEIFDNLNMPRVGYRNCLVKAVKAAKSYDRSYLIEKVAETQHVLQYVIVRKDVINTGSDLDGDALLDPNFPVEARFKFSLLKRKKGASAMECLTFQEGEDHEISRKIVEEYRNMAVIFTADDLRQSVNRFADSVGAVKLTRGNCWFFPVACKAKVAKLEEWLENCKCKLMKFPQFDVEQTVDNLQIMVGESLQDQFETLKNDIIKYKSDTKTRKSTLDGRLEMLDKLRGTASTYQAAISLDIEEITKLIESAEEDLVDFIAKMDN